MISPGNFVNDIKIQLSADNFLFRSREKKNDSETKIKTCPVSFCRCTCCPTSPPCPGVAGAPSSP